MILVSCVFQFGSSHQTTNFRSYLTFEHDVNNANRGRRKRTIVVYMSRAHYIISI